MKIIVAFATLAFDTVLCAASLNANDAGDTHRMMLLWSLATVVSIGAAMLIMTGDGESSE